MVVASRMGSRTSLHDGSLWTWTEGDHSGRADDATVIQATGIALTVGAWVRSPDAGTTIRQFGATPGAIVDGPLASAFGALSRVRTSPDGLNGWGVGRLGVGKGEFTLHATFAPEESQLGFTLSGEAVHATAFTSSGRPAGSAMRFRTYDGLTLEHFRLHNRGNAPGTSVGIELDGVGGGGNATLRRLAIDGFGTGVKLTSTVNADKTLYEQVGFGNEVGWSNGVNRQAICHHFLNCSWGSTLAHRDYGGSGEVLVTQASGDITHACDRILEGAGSDVAGRIVHHACAYEMNPTGDRLVLDAREAVLTKDGGGANVRVVYRDSRFDGGAATDWSNRTVIKVGNGASGSDAVTWGQFGGRLPPGRIRLASSQSGPNNARCRHVDAQTAPPPELLALEGPGNHALVGWTGCDNVPVDQYRGGQSFSGTIEAEKAHILPRHVGRAIVHTGVADGRTDFAGRKGKNFTFTGFPAGLTATGLGIYVDANGAGDTLVEWFSDAAFTALIASRAIPAARRGLAIVARGDDDKFQVTTGGALYVRVTRPALGDASLEGHLVMFYYPYVGA